jgi:hypothetical protein
METALLWDDPGDPDYGHAGAGYGLGDGGGLAFECGLDVVPLLVLAPPPFERGTNHGSHAATVDHWVLLLACG